MSGSHSTAAQAKRQFVRREFDKLAHAGLDVHEFSEFHYRIENHLDVMPNNRGGAWAWHDLLKDSRGWWWPEKLLAAVRQHLEENPLPPIHPMIAEPESHTFEGKLKALYVADRPWEEVWELVRAEIERNPHV